MAKTQIADIIEPRVFLDSVVERTAEVSRFLRSGIMEANAEFNSLASGKGKIFDMPFWNNLTGDSEVLSDSGSLTPAKIDQGQDKAHKHYRGRAWSANDLAKALAGDDPMGRVADLVADYKDRDMQKQLLIPSLTGIFATALASTHVNDVAIEDGDNAAAANLIGTDNIIDTIFKIGDAWERVVALAVHSVPFSRLTKLNLIQFEPLSEQGLMIPRFLGREVIVDDGLPKVAGSTSGFKYTSYLFGRGSVAFGDGGPPSLDAEEAVETDRDTLAGDDILVHRWHVIVHPRGVQFTGTPAGVSPTKTELETGSNWTAAWDSKNIVITKLVTNG